MLQYEQPVRTGISGCTTCGLSEILQVMHRNKDQWTSGTNTGIIPRTNTRTEQRPMDQRGIIVRTDRLAKLDIEDIRRTVDGQWSSRCAQEESELTIRQSEQELTNQASNISDLARGIVKLMEQNKNRDRSALRSYRDNTSAIL